MQQTTEPTTTDAPARPLVKDMDEQARIAYPAWLVALVIECVQRDLLAGAFPLVEVSGA